MNQLKWIICWLFFSGWLWAQNNGTIYIDPNKSNPEKRRVLIINSNQVSTDLTNYGTVGRGNDSDVASGGGGVWPRGTGHDHIHEVTGFIAGRVTTTDSLGASQPIYIISDGYRDAGGSQSEIDPVTNILWKFHPIGGYFNDELAQEDIANSLNPSSWPSSWPGKDAGWNNTWDGYFGLNQFNADQEVLYVMDDVWNKEYPFYPYASDTTRRGLGMQIETRLFQWAHPLAKDILFIHFQVSNAGDHTYHVSEDSIVFGGYGDIGVGGRGTTDDDAGYNYDMNMVYGWDHNNQGVWTKYRDIPPGYCGWKFLESPGIGNDWRDNDNDGMTDELRDNDAGVLISGQDAIRAYVQANYDFAKFEQRYGKLENLPAYQKGEWWNGDEDLDWNPDVDDVGTDGADSLTENYPGPDSDGSEGNGKPDQGEPNFGKLDNDESDQVGLTSFTAPMFGSVFISDEHAMWQRIKPGYFTVPQQNINQYWIFGSGPFNLDPQKTERFSTCWVFGYDERAIFQTGSVAQRIYDSDYRFARPPRQPKLTAVPGDNKVVLIWDDLSEQSRDPIYGFDFEGYRIYKSTDPQFLDAKDITDMVGNPAFKQPIAQYDLANGLKGPHPLQFGEEINSPTGIHFYMGNDTGLRHYYVDSDVINGRTYYYAVTAYDKGYDLDFYERGLSDNAYLFPITPSECPAAIIVSNGQVSRMDPNTAMATPNPASSNIEIGRTDVDEELDHVEGYATGKIEIQVIAPELLEDSTYMVIFSTIESNSPVEYETSTFSLINFNSGDTIARNWPVIQDFSTGNYLRSWSAEFLTRGFILTFDNQFPDKDSVILNSDWLDETATNFVFSVAPVYETSPIQPISFMVEFFDSTQVGIDSAYTSTRGTLTRPVNFKVYEYGSNQRLDVWFQEGTGARQNGLIDLGETINLLYKEIPTEKRFKASWGIKIDAPVDEQGNPIADSLLIRPGSGDKYLVKNRIPYESRDVYQFATIKGRAVEQSSDEVLKEIRVVPNPYIVSSILEQQAYLSGRGERFIRFTHLPAECTIRIYTINGDLLQTLTHSGVNDGTARWDLRSHEGLEVAFGLYIYHVEAPGIGNHIGKFAIIN